ncbi:hypothetical protein RUM43_011960 [Polyplax serrata]|uniref:Uncharacterized protein n=1 Tax=Polyplax serrata TaxID=468196 RepID=A0AAN8S6P0_POLSC
MMRQVYVIIQVSWMFTMILNRCVIKVSFLLGIYKDIPVTCLDLHPNLAVDSDNRYTKREVKDSYSSEQTTRKQFRQVQLDNIPLPSTAGHAIEGFVSTDAREQLL